MFTYTFNIKRNILNEIDSELMIKRLLQFLLLIVIFNIVFIKLNNSDLGGNTS